MKQPIYFLIFLLPAVNLFGQLPDKLKTEQELLAKARQGIEEFRKGDVKITVTDARGKNMKDVKIEVNQITQDFLFGNLCDELFDKSFTTEESTRFQEAFTGLFNFTELNIKWSPFEFKQGKPQWASLQKKLDWCEKHGITPKGHTLCWTNMSGTPPWLLNLPEEVTEKLSQARIYNLVGGFKDQITMWDVVNEPVTTVPWHVAMKDSVFGESLIDAGDRYDVRNITMEETIPWVENSLRWAYEANPQGDFMLNEFYIMAKPDIRQKYLTFLKELQRKGVVMTGVGIQAHEPREMWFSPVEIVRTFDLFSELGLPIHITELIPQSSGKPITGDWREGLWTEEAQAEFAEQFYTLAFGHPSVVSVHWWGLSDRYIWLEGGGLLDKQLQPKPVYHRLYKLIKEEWCTRHLQLKTNRKGTCSFRGFYGEYEISMIQEDGSEVKFKKSLKPDGDKDWNFSL